MWVGGQASAPVRWACLPARPPERQIICPPKCYGGVYAEARYNLPNLYGQKLRPAHFRGGRGPWSGLQVGAGRRQAAIPSLPAVHGLIAAVGSAACRRGRWDHYGRRGALWCHRSCLPPAVVQPLIAARWPVSWCRSLMARWPAVGLPPPEYYGV